MPPNERSPRSGKQRASEKCLASKLDNRESTIPTSEQQRAKRALLARKHNPSTDQYAGETSKFAVAKARAKMPRGFRETADGIEKRDDKAWRKVCSRLAIEADARDARNENWGRLLVVTDRDGKRHEWSMPMYMLAGDGKEYREKLLKLGLTIQPGPWGRNGLHEYISQARPVRKVLCVDQTGWHGGTFVLPEITVGRRSAERIVLQSEAPVEHAFNCAGSLASWQESVARYAIGSSRLVHALSTAAAAPLLTVAGEASAGFHYYGSSSRGKTTALLVAGSFWGGGRKEGYLDHWRATDNGLEAVAAVHNDTLLCLDEIAQVDARTAAAAAYMLSNGQGKRRASQRGRAEPMASWRLLFLSSGEMTLADKIAEDPRQRKTAGQAVRVIDIAADPGAGHGLFENLHGFASGEALSNHLRDACLQHYGTPAREFIAKVAEMDPKRLHATLKKSSGIFLEKNCPSSADGQVKRVANRFAHVAASGELAIELGIFPWPPGEAMRGVAACFASWLKARGGTGQFEEIEGIRAVLRFIRAHGAARFEEWDSESQRTVVDRVGWRKHNDSGEWEYFLTAEGWNEATRDTEPSKIASAMRDRGLLAPSKDGRNSVSRKPPGHAKMRLYHVLANALSCEDDGISEWSVS